jgi:hypothetical protein
VAGGSIKEEEEEDFLPLSPTALKIFYRRRR